MKHRMFSILGGIIVLIILLINLLVITSHFGMVDRLMLILFLILTITVIYYVLDLKYE